MQELILTNKSIIGKELVSTVNARNLHNYLGSKQDFSTWIKKRIADYGFSENIDYIVLHKKIEVNNQCFTRNGDKIEYHINFDMAKELGMLERNEKGREIRRYFIEQEKIANSKNRHIDAIRSLLLLDAPAIWEKLYPDDFFIAIMNLHGHKFNGNSSTPLYCANIIRRWIYDIVLPPELNFEIDTKRGLEKKHTWFNKDGGRSTLLAQISKVEMVARMSQSRVDFEHKCATAFLGEPLQLSVLL